MFDIVLPFSVIILKKIKNISSYGFKKINFKNYIFNYKILLTK
jgi:hypothetical protein